MTDVIVSKLKQQLEVAGIDTLHLSDKEAELFSRVFDQRASFFEHVCQSKPDKDPNMLLLGLLTKLQIEATGKLEVQINQINAMNKSLADTVGQHHADKFTIDSVIELSLVTKVWLMMLGYLNMDFSLANDHALNASMLLTQALHSHELDELRTELIASYYHGKEKRLGDEPHVQWSDKILSWFTTHD